MSDVVRIRDRARFSGPSVGSTIVERTRLDDHFNSAPGQVVRVLAPAGYGKSTLVARWVARDARSVCWLDLESIDDDPLVLRQALVNGLRDLRSRDFDGDVNSAAPFDEIARLVADSDEPFVLVPDDIHHLRGQESIQLLSLIIDKLARLDTCAPWFNILGLIPLLKTSLLLDDATTARELLQELEQKIRNQDPTTPLARCVEDLGDAVRAALEFSAERSWSLTTAQLRVAQYLPTNLSLADIATRLYVSRNTVKSHAAAIYRKLDTNSRAKAVDRMRRAGVIADEAIG